MVCGISLHDEVGPMHPSTAQPWLGLPEPAQQEHVQPCAAPSIWQASLLPYSSSVQVAGRIMTAQSHPAFPRALIACRQLSGLMHWAGGGHQSCLQMRGVACASDEPKDSGPPPQPAPGEMQCVPSLHCHARCPLHAPIQSTLLRCPSAGKVKDQEGHQRRQEDLGIRDSLGQRSQVYIRDSFLPRGVTEEMAAKMPAEELWWQQSCASGCLWQYTAGELFNETFREM